MRKKKIVAPFIFRNLALPLVYFILGPWIISGVVFLSPIYIPRSVGYFGNASAQYIFNISYDAKRIFEFKDILAKNKEDLNRINHFQNIRQHKYLSNTGYILAIAVIASDGYRRRGIASLPTAKNLESLYLLEDLITIEELRRKEKSIVLNFNPLSMISSSNLVEISMLLLIEDKIDAEYAQAYKSKLEKIMAQIDENHLKNHRVKILDLKERLKRLN